jgi:hypothetical protein
MIDKTPYIIVDNHKIPPIERLQRPAQAAGEEATREGKPFGVVDRVTLSREGREKSLELQARAEYDDEPAFLESPPKRPAITVVDLLTYTPKRRR